MARTHETCPPEFRQQLVALVKSGRTPSELAREYEPAADPIRNWVVQSERDAGARNDGLSTDDLPELRRLRRESEQLRTERDILKPAAEAPTAGRGAPQRPGLVVHLDRVCGDARRMRCGSRMSASSNWAGPTWADRRSGHSSE